MSRCGQLVMAAVLMVAATASPSVALGGEGTVSPILSAHLSVKSHTSLVVEIDAGARCHRALQVVFFELSAPPEASEAQLDWSADWSADWRARLAGSRVVTERIAVPGEKLILPLPPEVFGSAYALGALVLADTAASDPAAAIAFTSVALPLLDPAEPLPVPPAPGSIVITEFMKDPTAVSDVRGEWIELQNRSTETLDLEGWTLRDDGSNSTVIVAEVPGGGVIVHPGRFMVLARNGDMALNGGVAVDAVYSGFSLGNGSDEIILEAPGRFLMDRVDYLDAGAEGWPDASGASIALSPGFIGLPAAGLGSSWCSGTEALPFGDLGTPGSVNSDCE